MRCDAEEDDDRGSGRSNLSDRRNRLSDTEVHLRAEYRYMYLRAALHKNDDPMVLMDGRVAWMGVSLGGGGFMWDLCIHVCDV